MRALRCHVDHLSYVYCFLHAFGVARCSLLVCVRLPQHLVRIPVRDVVQITLDGAVVGVFINYELLLLEVLVRQLDRTVMHVDHLAAIEHLLLLLQQALVRVLKGRLFDRVR